MTTIAWKGRTLAADTQLTWTDNSWSYCRKIVKLGGEQGAIAYAGQVDSEYHFHKWFLAGENLNEWDHFFLKKPSFSAIYIDKYKDVWTFNDGPERMLIEHEFHAIGSGNSLASAALHLGMTAKDAILFASELDTTTNNLVDTYDIQTGKLTLASFPRGRPRQCLTPQS